MVRQGLQTKDLTQTPLLLVLVSVPGGLPQSKRVARGAAEWNLAKRFFLLCLCQIEPNIKRLLRRMFLVRSGGFLCLALCLCLLPFLASFSVWPHIRFVVTEDFKHDKSLKYHWAIMLTLYNWVSACISVCLPRWRMALQQSVVGLGALKRCCHSYFTDCASRTQELV